MDTMDCGTGLDRWLISPAQNAALRRRPLDKAAVKGTLRTIGLAFLGELVLLLLFSAGLGAGAVITQQSPAQLGGEWLGTFLDLLATGGMVGVILFSFRADLGQVGCRRPFGSEYLMGAFAGLGVFSAAVCLCVLSGTLVIDNLSPDFRVGPWLLIFAGFLLQGFSEELLCRGLLMPFLSRLAVRLRWKSPALLGVLLNSALFAALHLGNSGVAPLALFNLFLFGVFASLYCLWRGNLWGIAAFHSLWNFTQGNIFGILVSGTGCGPSLFAVFLYPEGALIHGGAFGLEGGLAVTAVLILGIVLLARRNMERIAKTPTTPDNHGKDGISDEITAQSHHAL